MIQSPNLLPLKFPRGWRTAIIAVFFSLTLIGRAFLLPLKAHAQDDLFPPEKPTAEQLNFDQKKPVLNEADSDTVLDPAGVPIPQDILETVDPSLVKDNGVFPPPPMGSTPTPAGGQYQKPADQFPGQSDEAEPTPEPVPTWMPIVKHFKFNEGKDFVVGPTPTPFYEPEKFKTEFMQKWAEGAKDYPSTKEQLEAEILKNIKAPDISQCLQDRSDSIEAPDGTPEGLLGEGSPFQDTLFLEPKDLPEDPETIYGITTIFVPFVKDQPNIGWEYINDMGVPCLPFRVRFQAHRVYFDQGMPALKNYSKSPKGEYHPYIKSLYNLGNAK